MVYITEESLDVLGLLKEANDPKVGAAVLFSGQVRDHHRGKDVIGIFYEAFEPMASSMIKDLLANAKEEFGLTYAHAVHRIGNVGISEPAVLVLTCHSHRENAYLANRYIIDQLKKEVPIWKKELYSDGTYYWGVQ